MDAQIPGWNQFNQSEHFGRKRFKTRRSIWFHTVRPETFQRIAERCADGVNRNSSLREALQIRSGWGSWVESLSGAYAENLYVKLNF